MPKRRCKFIDELKSKYPCFRTGRMGWEAECMTCTPGTYISIANKGSEGLEIHVLYVPVRKVFYQCIVRAHTHVLFSIVLLYIFTRTTLMCIFLCLYSGYPHVYTGNALGLPNIYHYECTLRAFTHTLLEFCMFFPCLH
jgi:hypothetical protein